MTTEQQATGAYVTHPAYTDLQAAVNTKRQRLAHALSIEYDWHYHDGPEWAARYWQTFGDLTIDQADTPADRAHKPRHQWPRLSPSQAHDVRTIFRSLLAVAHAEIDPSAAADARAMLWPAIRRAYRRGDHSALVAAWSETRALVRRPKLPEDVVALRHEHDRLIAAIAAADRRLARLNQSFPFNIRDKLDDADWVRHQRRALAQIRALIQTPAGDIPCKRVS